MTPIDSNLQIVLFKVYFYLEIVHKNNLTRSSYRNIHNENTVN